MELSWGGGAQLGGGWACPSPAKLQLHPQVGVNAPEILKFVCFLENKDVLLIRKQFLCSGR